MVVSDLFIPGTYFWDIPVIRETLSEEDAQRIIHRATPPVGIQDSLIWHFDRSGCYTVHLVLNSEDQRHRGWNRLWALQLALKIKA